MTASLAKLPSLEDLKKYGLKILREAASGILMGGIDLIEGRYEKIKPEVKAFVYARVPGEFLDAIVWEWVEAQLPELFEAARKLALELKEQGVTLSGAEAHGLSGAVALAVYRDKVLVPFAESIKPQPESV